MNENRKIQIKEVFLGFFSKMDQKDAGSLVNKILQKLEQDKFPPLIAVSKHTITQQLWLE